MQVIATLSIYVRHECHLTILYSQAPLSIIGTGTWALADDFGL